MKFQRTDIHRPGVINPQEYEFVSFEHMKIGGSGDIMGDCAYLQECRAGIAAHMQRTGGTYAQHEHGGNCMVCGAACIYTALFYHRLTNSYIRTGQECADKMGIGDQNWNLFHNAVKSANELHAGKRKAQTVLAEAGLSDCWQIYLDGGARFIYPGITRNAYGNPFRADGTPWTDADQEAYWAAYREFNRKHQGEQTVFDIVGKLIKYGSISEKQLNFLRSLLDRIKRQPEIDAKRAAEAAAAADCPSGRIEVEGVVLTIRVDDTDFGPTTKILVKHDTGYKVWGTRPSIPVPQPAYYYCAEVGDRIAFRATVTPSDKDPKFGFFSRPTNGRLVAQKQPVAC